LASSASQMISPSECQSSAVGQSATPQARPARADSSNSPTPTHSRFCGRVARSHLRGPLGRRGSQPVSADDGVQREHASAHDVHDHRPRTDGHAYRYLFDHPSRGERNDGLGYGGHPAQFGQWLLFEDVLYAQYFLPTGKSIHYNYWSSNWGYPGSHGCLGLSYGDAAFMWSFAGIVPPCQSTTEESRILITPRAPMRHACASARI
jgi:hypothetical protein